MGILGDPFWPVKFGQLFYANWTGLRGSHNFTYFDTGGNNLWWKKAQKQSCRDQLQQMSLNPFLLILNPLCDLSQKIQCKSLLGLLCQCLPFSEERTPGSTWTFNICPLNFMGDYLFILPSVKF